MTIEQSRRSSGFSVLTAALLCLSISSVAGAVEQVVPVTTIAAGTTSGISTLTIAVIRNQARWTTLWRKHLTGTGQGDRSPPIIDFTQQMVIAIFAGQATPDTRPTILRVVRDTKQLRVIYRLATPQPGPTPLDRATATPFLIVRLARSPLPVVFVRAEVRDTDTPGDRSSP